MTSRLDIVVYGATGFTGKYTLPQVHKFANAEQALTWGVAGRSELKLKSVLTETAKKIGVNDLSSIPIIIADSNDEESVKRMTARAKVIVNCCGPYELYGEVVVKSCIETGTHHVDISVEPLFVEGMELKYRKAAEEKGVYIVSACGVGSIPADLGLVFLEKNFEGTLNSVETYACISEEGGLSLGPIMHFGTWESLVYGLKNIRKFMTLHAKLQPNPLPNLNPKLSWRFPFRKEPNKWAVAYPIIDKDVVLRSQRYFYEHGKRPVQIYCYGIIDSFTNMLRLAFFSIIVAVLSQLQCGRKLLLQYPKLFTAGFASREELSEEALMRHHFSWTLEGVGWREEFVDGEDQYTTKPNKAIVGRVSGTNPGYGFTSLALVLCAIVILTQQEKLPAKGGVYTTAAAFSETSLIQELQKNGVNFEIISTKDIS